MVIKLQSVAVGQPCRLLQSDARWSFSRQAVFIFDRHDPVAEITLGYIEVQAVHSDQFREGNIISLLLPILQVVPKHKASLFARMRMEIHIHKEILVEMSVLGYYLLHCVNCRVMLFWGVKVKPVQVQGPGV